MGLSVWDIVGEFVQKLLRAGGRRHRQLAVYDDVVAPAEARPRVLKEKLHVQLGVGRGERPDGAVVVPTAQAVQQAL